MTTAQTSTPPAGPPFGPLSGPVLAPPSSPPSFPLRWERREPPLPAVAVLALGDAVPALAAATRDGLLDGARLAVLADDGPLPDDSPLPADGPLPDGPAPHDGLPPHDSPPPHHGVPPHLGAPPAQRLLLVLGAEDELPWADGARYLGRDAGLLVPTTARPGPAAALWRRALGAADGQLCVLVPGHALVADPPPPVDSPAALEPYTRSAAR
ncbi:hypothetical protein ACFVHB_08795 [Kitasatospora sp. NPDC127111]|uniref:bpX5 domain-containing protein n=1 Tax=Kitasatospora sp. NPDC127111 TaxID=3345363 RepID=UPI003644AD21